MELNLQANASESRIVNLLKEIFFERRERNKAYSLSSFARDLGISKSVLSRVLSSDRPVSVKLAMHLMAVLEVEEIESKRILLSVIQSQSANAKISKKLKEKLEKELVSAEQKNSPQYSTVEIEQFKAMASWQHLAILNLSKLKDFKNSPLWIAKRLGISTVEARDSLERLISLGLIQEKEEKLKRTKKSLFIKTERSEVAIRKFHEQMIGKALEELKDTRQTRFEKRLINGITFTCSEEQIPLLKKKIDELQDEFLSITTEENATDLMQFNVQLFPLTKDEMESL